MTIEEAKNYCLSLNGTYLCTPFDETTEVIKHRDNNKMFALFSSPGEKYSINLKCEPMEADFLRSIYQGVVPGYHMNKRHWNTVYLTSDVPDDEILRMIDNSYKLTEKRQKRKR